jgi:Flp pilus assembly protein CpaB
MRGIQGLILAIGLGIAGAIFNFAYLANRSRDVEKVAFVGVKEDKTVGRGERLTEDVLEPVEIPRRWVGNLGNFAVKWEARATVTGRRVWRPLDGGSLLLLADLKNPPQELAFGQNLPQGTEERAWGVPIDTRRFVASLVQPGDQVDFLVGGSRADFPTLAQPGKGPSEAAKVAAAAASLQGPTGDGVEIIGPFRVLSVGNRLGNADVMQAAKLQQTQENVLTIAVRYENGKLQPTAARLQRIIDQSNSRPLIYQLHSRTQKQP